MLLFVASFSSFPKEIEQKGTFNVFPGSLLKLVEPQKPMEMEPVVGTSGSPCCVPTWVEHAENDALLKKFE